MKRIKHSLLFLSLGLIPATSFCPRAFSHNPPYKCANPHPTSEVEMTKITGQCYNIEHLFLLFKANRSCNMACRKYYNRSNGKEKQRDKCLSTCRELDKVLGKINDDRHGCCYDFECLKQKRVAACYKLLENAHKLAQQLPPISDREKNT
jgi:hypothetical protein